MSTPPNPLPQPGIAPDGVDPSLQQPAPPQPAPKQEAMSLRTQGANPRIIEIDAMDIQEEFEILPEEGSTLADDDSYRTGKLQQLLQVALSAPAVFNVRNIAAAFLKSVPGISPEEGLAPPPQAPPPPPPRIGVNISVPWEALAPDVQVALLGMSGLPTAGTEVTGTIKHTADAIEHVGRAADSAAKLAEPAAPQPKLPTPAGMGGSNADNS